MIEETIAQAGLGGIALYLMYRLSNTSLTGVKQAIDDNTQALLSLIEFLEGKRTD